MSGVSLPVTRPAGRALLVASDSCRPAPLKQLRQRGFQCSEVADPYAAMAELARRPMAYWTLVLSLNSIYREELLMISAVKRRWPNIEIWLTQTDGRAAALDQAMQLGADGLLNEDGLHRTAASAPPKDAQPAMSLRPVEDLDHSAAPVPVPFVAEAHSPVVPPPGESADGKKRRPNPNAPKDARELIDQTAGEPVLTIEELRALLDESPPSPDHG